CTLVLVSNDDDSAPLFVAPPALHDALPISATITTARIPPRAPIVAPHHLVPLWGSLLAVSGHCVTLSQRGDFPPFFVGATDTIFAPMGPPIISTDVIPPRAPLVAPNHLVPL